MSENAIRVVQGDEPVPVEVEPRNAPTSVLAGLAARRRKALEALHLDLAVPDYLERLGVDLFVRYRPLEAAVTTKLAEVANKSKNPERLVNANASALAASCEGIFFVVDGVEKALDPDDEDGPWPTFERRVAAALGVDWISPVHLVRDLYFTDDQVNATAQRLQQWSEGEIRERETTDSGN